MKSIKFFILMLAILAGTQCIALQTNSIEGAKNINKNTAIQVKKGTTSTNLLEYMSKYNELMNRYVKNFRSCESLHMNQSIDLFGLKISYQIDVNGWVDNKCSYYMTGNIGGIGKDIREVFNVKATDETIAAIKPKLKCNFTQSQLNTLVDGFLAAQERKMAEAAETSMSAEKSIAYKKTKLSPAEEKLVAMLVTENVCTVPNKDELMEQFNKLVSPNL